MEWNTILKAYLLAKDPEKNPLEDERRPFSIGGLTYDEYYLHYFIREIIYLINIK